MRAKKSPRSGFSLSRMDVYPYAVKIFPLGVARLPWLPDIGETRHGSIHSNGSRSDAEREARLLMNLEHKALVKVHDYFTDHVNKSCFIVMVGARPPQPLSHHTEHSIVHRILLEGVSYSTVLC